MLFMNIDLKTQHPLRAQFCVPAVCRILDELGARSYGVTQRVFWCWLERDSFVVINDAGAAQTVALTVSDKMRQVRRLVGCL
jgi:hypothetical protein